MTTPPNQQTPEPWMVAAAHSIATYLQLPDGVSETDIRSIVLRIASHCPQPDREARRLLEEAAALLDEGEPDIATLDETFEDARKRDDYCSRQNDLTRRLRAYLSRTADKEGGGT